MPREKPRKTLEASAYASGVYSQFREQAQRYEELLTHLLSVQAQVDLAERNLCNTRDHLRMMVAKPEVNTQAAWKDALGRFRFLGYRLADACTDLLQQKKSMTFDQLLDGLNSGQFRFRSGHPLREIHAALLRNPNISREGDVWTWTGPPSGEQQTKLKLMPSDKAVAN
jgi:hypothetical protein